MSFDWHLFLGLAKQLASSQTGTPADEAALRTAGGRAYYAAFLLARDRAQRSGQTFPNTGEAHKLVPRYYEALPGQGPSIAQTLKTLRLSRTGCDYEATHAVTANGTKLLCAMAEATIDDIDHHR